MFLGRKSAMKRLGDGSGNHLYGLSYSKHALARFRLGSKSPSLPSRGLEIMAAGLHHEHDAKHSVTYYIFVTFSVPE